MKSSEETDPPFFAAPAASGNRKMKALYFDEQLSLRQVAEPRPAAAEALIRVILAGICGTDRELLKGYSGFRGIPGHEFVGEVVGCDTVAWIGKRVVGEINITCGHCEWCRRGCDRHCSQRTVMGIIDRPGAFAEYVALPLANLHEVPSGVSDEAAVFTEPLAAAAEILEQLPLTAGTRVAVLGCGRLGLLVAQVLNHSGACVTVIGRREGKLTLARSWGLSTFCLHPDAGTEKSAAGAMANVGVNGKTEPPRRSFPIVVEATGSPFGLDEAFRLVEPRGTIVMKSTFHGPAHFDTAKLVVDEITLLGSRCGNFRTALDLLNQGAIHVRELISRVFTLEQGVEAFHYLDQSVCLKVLLSNAGRSI
ncbi:MAG TPA: alcohol dehydrogenase catalytic domain-containing protein [Terriglobia bacterium]